MQLALRGQLGKAPFQLFPDKGLSLLQFHAFFCISHIEQAGHAVKMGDGVGIGHTPLLYAALGRRDASPVAADTGLDQRDLLPVIAHPGQDLSGHLRPMLMVQLIKAVIGDRGDVVEPGRHSHDLLIPSVPPGQLHPMLHHRRDVIVAPRTKPVSGLLASPVHLPLQSVQYCLSHSSTASSKKVTGRTPSRQQTMFTPSRFCQGV